MAKITNLEKLLVNLGEKDKGPEKGQERESRSNITVKFTDDGKTSSRNDPEKSARTSNFIKPIAEKPVRF